MQERRHGANRSRVDQISLMIQDVNVHANVPHFLTCEGKETLSVFYPISVYQCPISVCFLTQMALRWTRSDSLTLTSDNTPDFEINAFPLMLTNDDAQGFEIHAFRLFDAYQR